MQLTPEQVRKTCDPNEFGCSTSEEMEPARAVIGQTRAVRALTFGLGIKALGFNIYVAGMPGTGRTTAARSFLEELAKGQPAPADCCYVNRFRDPYRPRALCLPAGQGRVFQGDVHGLVQEARAAIRRAFESDEYAAQRETTVRQFQSQRDAMFQAINERALAQGFLIRGTQAGVMTIPIKEGKPLGEEEFAALTPEEREAIGKVREKVQGELEAAFRQARALEKGANEALQKLDQQVGQFALSPLIDELRRKYAALAHIVAHLDEVEQDILENLALFRADNEEAAPAGGTPFPMPGAKELPFRKYQVNVLVDNGALKGAPVIIELNPTYNNLFGRIEREAQFGALFTDFTMIREGSLHRANGGYLVLPAEEVLRNPFAWDGLKRALRNREIVIEDAGDRMGLFSTKSLSPEPVRLDIKVVLIGQPMVYNLLYAYDEDFRELFKVKADFDTRMERNEATMREYASFVCNVVQNEGLRHLDGTALTKLIEHGSRLADDQKRLSTRFGDLSDILREANYYAVQEDSRLVAGEHVRRAIEEKFYRSALVQERIQELIAQGVIKIDVAGAKVGQVNGLSVASLGDIQFGQPSRITAVTSLGQDGIVDIEREAKLSGPIHTKGVLILAGFLADLFAQDKPLSLSARLVFEQNYGGVEGDSASSTELYALLSSLAGAPIQQGIAVTGSVNQRGEVQAIGGVNEKIEGFFQVCKLKGLTGAQGVMIPASNAQNLMLREDVAEAVRAGQFHVWAVQTIEEGIEVLTGVQAGGRNADGTFEPESIYDRADRRLREMARQLRKAGKDDDETKGKPAENDGDEAKAVEEPPQG
jgi:predicted ATP-dependent protease